MLVLAGGATLTGDHLTTLATLSGNIRNILQPVLGPRPGWAGPGGGQKVSVSAAAVALARCSGAGNH